MARSVSDVLLEILADVGVRHIFGIPGDAINSLVDAIRRQDAIGFVQMRHEEAGALAAAAQAKLTGGLAACVGTAGPGAVHLLNGLYDAKLDHAPVMAITGQVETHLLGTDYHQEIDLYTLFKDVAAFNQTIVNPEQLPDAVVNACQAALSQGTVAHLSLPIDVAGQDVPDPGRRHPVFGNRAESAPCQADLDAAVELLDSASKVAILAGVGARDGAGELVELAERLGAPIIKTLRAKDLLADDHPLCAGGLGLLGTRAAVGAIEDCDVLLMVGTDFPTTTSTPPRPGPSRSTSTRAGWVAATRSTSAWSATPTWRCGRCATRWRPSPTAPTWVGSRRRWPRGGAACGATRPATTRRSSRSGSLRSSARSPPTTPCSAATPARSRSGRPATSPSAAPSGSRCRRAWRRWRSPCRPRSGPSSPTRTGR